VLLMLRRIGGVHECVLSSKWKGDDVREEGSAALALWKLLWVSLLHVLRVGQLGCPTGAPKRVVKPTLFAGMVTRSGAGRV